MGKPTALPWDIYPARWTARAVWRRVLLGAVIEPAEGEALLPPTSLDHLSRFVNDVLVQVRGKRETAWRALQINAGDVMFRPVGLPSQLFRWRAAGPIPIVHVNLLPDPQAAPLRMPPNLVFKLPDPMLAQLVEGLHSCAIAGRPADDRYVESASELLALQLRESVRDAIPAAGPGALAADALRRVCAHIDAHLAERLALPGLAELAGVSRAHFARAFKAATGIAPARYVQKRRLLWAQKLLRSSDRSLVDIALETGFSSQSSFTTAFRSVVGESPARYRRSQTARDSDPALRGR